jgi:glutamine synthetase
MLPVKTEDHPTLATVQDLFDQWRKEKKHRDPIPSSLWEAALALTDSHSVCAVAKRLRLNYTNFKALTESRPVRTTPTFIELAPLVVTIEMTKPTGERMTITGSCNAAELVRVFLE